MDLSALIDSINASRGTRYRDARPMPGGESASTCAVFDHRGEEHILKWGAPPEFRMRQALAITRRLRSRGYPAPEYVLSGHAEGVDYLLQRMLPGKPATALTFSHIDRVLALNGLQETAGAELKSDWPARILTSIESGFAQWCVHASLIGHSAETASMLEELKRTATAVGAGTFRTTDAVHFDFNPANILVDSGEISGVIDWNGCCPGDRAFDLATLGFYAIADESVSLPLLRRAEEISGRGPVALYLSHMILRQVDWSIRHHQPQIIAHYLGVARLALRRIQELVAPAPGGLR